MSVLEPELWSPDLATPLQINMEPEQILYLRGHSKELPPPPCAWGVGSRKARQAFKGAWMRLGLIQRNR